MIARTTLEALDLPNDGAARHLKRGKRLPDLELPATDGRLVNFARLGGRSVVYCYPFSGQPGSPDPPGWDTIPGAHGSTPQAAGFRDLYQGFLQADAAVFGVSTQSPRYQREFAERLALPFALVSDATLLLQRALRLPTFTAGGVTYLKRLTLAIGDGRIERVFYPVAAPAAHAREVCAWLGMTSRAL
jgi:peroxiredoxin